MNILLSIHPEYVEKIISGIKKYEYRKRLPKEKVSKIYIYSTKPICKVVAEVEIDDVLVLPPNELWNMTKLDSGLSRKEFFGYFNGSSTSSAFKLGNLKIYDRPKELSAFKLKQAPQSFVYIK